MILNKFDTCIIGQGLAGTTLAWALHRRGQKIAVIDQGQKHSSSQIAAGLITPVTGKRFVKSKRFDEFWNSAKTFYLEIESITETSFFHQQNSIRLFASKDERDLFTQKSVNDFPESVHFLEQPVNKISFNIMYGGFEMNHAARLDIPCYLDVSQKYFAQQAASIQSGIEPEADLKFGADAVLIPEVRNCCRPCDLLPGLCGNKKSLV